MSTEMAKGMKTEVADPRFLALGIHDPLSDLVGAFNPFLFLSVPIPMPEYPRLTFLLRLTHSAEIDKNPESGS